MGKALRQPPIPASLPALAGRRAPVVDDVAQARHLLTGMLSEAESGTAALAEALMTALRQRLAAV